MELTADQAARKLGPAAVLTEPDIRAILATFSRRAPTGIRNRALVLTLWRTGLRISEALDLERGDLALDGGTPTLTVRRGKGGRSRVVGVHQEAAAALEHWHAARARAGAGRARPVFCCIDRRMRGQPMQRTYVAQMLTRKAQQAGVTARVHPHAFRATLAVELAREGVPLPAIRDVLGHSNVAHTDAYLRRVFPADAIAAVVDRPDPRELVADRIARLDDAAVARIAEALA